MPDSKISFACYEDLIDSSEEIESWPTFDEKTASSLCPVTDFGDTSEFIFLNLFCILTDSLWVGVFPVILNVIGPALLFIDI